MADTTPPKQPVTPTVQTTKEPSVADALAHLAKAKQFYSDTKFLQPGFNPHFALKEINDLEILLGIPDSPTIRGNINKSLNIKMQEPTLKALNTEAWLYRQT